jgi:hypothetical protein
VASEKFFEKWAWSTAKGDRRFQQQSQSPFLSSVKSTTRKFPGIGEIFLDLARDFIIWRPRLVFRENWKMRLFYRLQEGYGEWGE